MTSNTKTDISSRSSTSSITVQDDVSTRDDFARLGSVLKSERNDKSQAKEKDIEKDRNKFVLGRNRRYIVSPFRIRRNSLDLTKPKNVVEDFGVDGKSLAYIQESVEEKSSELVKDSKDCDLQSNTAVRWRITIRRRRANANSEVCHVLSRKIQRRFHSSLEKMINLPAIYKKQNIFENYLIRFCRTCKDLHKRILTKKSYYMNCHIIFSIF